MVSTASFPLIAASCTIKVVYNHTRIASYGRWSARSVGKPVRLLAFDSRSAELPRGLSSNPILSGLRRTELLLTECFTIFCNQNPSLDTDPESTKCLDPDSDSKNSDPQQRFKKLIYF